jgi:hypothetical protein
LLAGMTFKATTGETVSWSPQRSGIVPDIAQRVACRMALTSFSPPSPSSYSYPLVSEEGRTWVATPIYSRSCAFLAI